MRDYIHFVKPYEELVYVKFPELLLSFDDLSSIRFDVYFINSRSTLQRCHHSVCYMDKLLVPQNIFPDNQKDLDFLEKPPQLETKISTRRSLVTGQKVVKYQPSFKQINPKLNERQILAIERILKVNSSIMTAPYILFGPPGTGKTLTLVELILQIIKNPSTRQLVCTPSNSAADLLVERIIYSMSTYLGIMPIPGIDLTRINAFRRVGENIPSIVRPFCEDSLIKFSNAEDTNEKGQNQMEIGKELLHICQAKVIIATCGTAGSMFRLNLPYHHFTHVIVDECGYASEPETWIPLCLAGSNAQIILAGDPKQLGPVLTSHFAEEQGLGTSMIERLMTTSKRYTRSSKFKNYGYYNPNYITKLIQNYRSHPQLLTMPSKLFYNNELIASAKALRGNRFLGASFLPNPNIPLIVIDVKNGSGEFTEEYGSSKYNPTEVLYVIKYVQLVSYCVGSSSEHKVAPELFLSRFLSRF